MEMDYSKHMYFQWKIKWQLEHLGTLGVMDEVAPVMLTIIRYMPLMLPVHHSSEMQKN